LYGEGLEYAARLPPADVQVEPHRFEDGFHPFFGFFCASRAAARANDAVCQAFAALLRAPGAQGTEQRGVDR
jgi:acetyl esterase